MLFVTACACTIATVCDLFMFNICFYLSICSVLVHSSHNTVCGRVKMVMRAISSRSLCVIGSAMHSTATVQFMLY